MSGPQSPPKLRGPLEVLTNRGTLRIDSQGTLTGLWELVGKELKSNAQVRHLCRNVKRRGGRAPTKPLTRSTIIYWRRKLNFPDPVVELDHVEYWSRSDVERWLEERHATEQTV